MYSYLRGCSGSVEASAFEVDGAGELEGAGGRSVQDLGEDGMGSSLEGRTGTDKFAHVKKAIFSLKTIEIIKLELSGKKYLHSGSKYELLVFSSIP